MRKSRKQNRFVSLPSVYAARADFRRAVKSVGSGWSKWSAHECIEVAMAFADQVRFRDVLVSRAGEKRRRFVSVAAAARILKMHRASVHRYLQQRPHLRNAKGKVILGRLIEEVSRVGRQLETRGRKTAMRPRRPKLNNLPAHLAPFANVFSEFWAWRKELGQAWLRYSPEDCLDVAEALAPVAEFVAKMNQRALSLLQAAGAGRA